MANTLLLIDAFSDQIYGEPVCDKEPDRIGETPGNYGCPSLWQVQQVAPALPLDRARPNSPWSAVSMWRSASLMRG